MDLNDHDSGHLNDHNETKFDKIPVRLRTFRAFNRSFAHKAYCCVKRGFPQKSEIPTLFDTDIGLYFAVLIVILHISGSWFCCQHFPRGVLIDNMH